MKRREFVGVLVVVAAAFALRAWGADFGLPHTYHPDEHQYVDTALAVLGGEPNPGRFNNPSLYKYALAAVDAVWYVVGRAAGAFASVDEFRARAAADPTAAYRLARLVTALLGALTVAATYALGRAVRDRRAGALAAVFLAATYLHVRESHFATSDVPATLLATLALVACARVAAGGTRRDYALAGLWIGAATATKYSSLAVVVSLVAAHLLAAVREDRRRRDADGNAADLSEDAGPTRTPSASAPDSAAGTSGASRSSASSAAGQVGPLFGTLARGLADRRLLVAGLVATLTFLVTVPYAVLDWPAFHADVALLAERGRTGFKGLELSPDPGWLFYGKTLAWGMEVPLFAAALLGVAAALVRRRGIDLVLVVFPLFLYAYLAPQLLLFERFILPALPVLAVLAAVLLGGLVDRLPWSGRARPTALAGIAIALIALPTVASLRFDWLLTQTDTRSLAQEWIEANIPPGTKMLVHSNGPQLAGIDSPAAGARVTYDLTEVGTTELVERPLSTYRDEGFEYLVLSSFSSSRRLLDPTADAAHSAYYAGAEWRELTLVRAFAPFDPGEGRTPPPFRFAQVYGPATDLWRHDRPGPEILVYRFARD